MGVRLFVGGHAGTIQGEREDLAGDRMFSAAHQPQAARNRAASKVTALIDSGAFSDPWERRLTPDAALDRQFKFERKCPEIWQSDPWQSEGFVSYDLLIDEVWVAGERTKRRWSVGDAERAVRVTVEAAHYLASQRERIEPRRLILSCQGVDAIQYAECADEVLSAAQPHDWIGLGGWCILGRQRRWMPTFWQTIRLVLPRVKAAGVGHVHIFGVMYLPALGGLLWLADQIGLTVSTDSTAPILNCTWKDKKKSGARCDYWRDNVAWWQNALANLRSSEHYRRPPELPPTRQLSLMEDLCHA